MCTITKFLQERGPTIKSKAFKFVCPVCQTEVSARNEVAFNATHLEKCLASGNSVGNGLQAAQNDSATSMSSFSDSLLPSTFGPEPTASNSKNDSASSSGSCVSKSDSSSEDQVTCPVCQCELSVNLVNDHLDQCLNLPKKRKGAPAVGSQTITKRTKFNSIDTYFTRL